MSADEPLDVPVIVELVERYHLVRFSSPSSFVATRKRPPRGPYITQMGVLQEVRLLEEVETTDPRTQYDQPAARTGRLELVGRSS